MKLQAVFAFAVAVFIPLSSAKSSDIILEDASELDFTKICATLQKRIEGYQCSITVPSADCFTNWRDKVFPKTAEEVIEEANYTWSGCVSSAWPNASASSTNDKSSQASNNTSQGRGTNGYGYSYQCDSPVSPYPREYGSGCPNKTLTPQDLYVGAFCCGDHGYAVYGSKPVPTSSGPVPDQTSSISDGAKSHNVAAGVSSALFATSFIATLLLGAIGVPHHHRGV